MILDLFAGPGGWSEGLRSLGRHCVGVELDGDACTTARTAGHARLQRDVRALDPDTFSAYAPVVGLIASPPCQGFSTAGKRRGRGDAAVCMHVAQDIADDYDSRATFAGACEDALSLLVVEPLRYALALRPRWIAFEQVPAVLPFWEACAGHFARVGYSVWTGKLGAEEYGVPQTRQRAFLIASRDQSVAAPAPTHDRFNPRGSNQRDPQRLPFVSMADALGWNPADVVGFPRRARSDRPDETRATVTIGGEEYRARDLRVASLPAFVVTEKARSWRRWLVAAGRTGEGRPRRIDTPAPTITGAANAYWLDDLAGWQRKAAQVADVKPIGDGCERITVAEAAVLQGFRADYPWHGTRTAQFAQIGNAVPPLLARAVLEAAGVVKSDELQEAA